MKNDSKIKKWITFSQGWDGFPIAYHLKLEGEDSIIAQIQDRTELKLDKDKEDPEDKKQRLLQYEGLIKKYPARKVVDALKKVKNKDEYFIFFDQNNLFAYAEELIKAGFTKGLFPRKEDYEMEKGRESAMEFVEKNYPDIKIIPHQKIKTVDEAKKIVQESDVPLVIQSEGDFVSTICPVDDVELNHAEIMSALDKHAKDYAKGEIILKEKLVQPIEITPQIVFWDGEPVFTDLDIETKNIGDGENNGNQVGCGSNLIIKTEFEDEINKIAFPPIVFEMASKRKGIFVWDISLYITDKGIFFGEFCSNRMGYDALMTEMTMSGGAKKFFTAVSNGQNPLKSKFGAAIRIFNLNRQAETEVNMQDHNKYWMYEITSKDDKITSVGNGWDLGVITGKGETIEEAVDEVYDNLSEFSFKEKYSRTKDDFLDDYPTSIIHRFNATNHTYYEAPDMEKEEEEEKEEYDFDGKFDDFKSDITKMFNALRKDVSNAMTSKEMKELRDYVDSIINE